MSEAETEAHDKAWIDLQDLPFKLGLNKSSGQDMRTWAGTVMTRLSGIV
jgi:hypothetical protein